jgi:hypothetical protein
LQDLVSITRPVDFQDKRSVETQIVEMCQECRPIDLPVAGRKMIIAVTVIVTGMNHP